VDEVNVWRKCSACKKPILFLATYYVCSVSTCNGQRTGYVFCSVSCFETHLPGARHRDAGAIEKKAPSAASAAPAAAGAGNATSANPPLGSSVSDPRKRVLATTPAAPTHSSTGVVGAKIPREVLVVVSKVKDYIRARAEMNTSDAIMMMLSDRIRELCDDAIDAARAEGRKTVLDRDLKKSKE